MIRPTHNPSRRGIVRSLAAGSILFPGILQSLLAEDARGSMTADANPLAPRAPHFPGKAKRVIFLYMSGGVSHMDTFDPKPKLLEAATASKPRPAGQRPYMKPLWDFAPNARCGTMVSDLFPNVREVMDDVCLIRSMKGDHNDHFQATLGIHTGSVTFARPSIGSWISYGLGTENQNLPSFVVLAPYLPYAGTQSWDADFLPAVHQGTRVQPGEEPVRDLKRRSASLEIQEAELDLLARFNRKHLQPRSEDSRLA